MENLTLSLAQISVANASPEKNLAKADLYSGEAAAQGSSLIVFPEMWTTGFNWNYLKKNLDMHTQIVEEVGKLAKKHRIWINGSMPTVNETRGIFNTSILFSPEGNIHAAYNKIHLFTLLPEYKHIIPGNEPITVETPWGKTGFATCYDLRFPELFLSYALNEVNVVILPAAFPNPRMEHWKTLTKARAIEDQMYMVCVNQVGTEQTSPNESLTYFGCSTIVDPWGETIVECPADEESLKTVTIDLNRVKKVRQKMCVLKDRHPEVYKLKGQKG